VNKKIIKLTPHLLLFSRPYLAALMLGLRLSVGYVCRLYVMFCG